MERCWEGWSGGGAVVALCTAGLLASPSVWAADASGSAAAPPIDRYELSVRSETYVQWFRRALLPGPGGAIVTTDTLVPVHEYFSLRASDLDLPFATDSVDVQVGGWGVGTFGRTTGDRHFDGDLHSAFARLRWRAASVTLGRQQVAGGAARYSRFDGLRAGYRLMPELSVDAYGGLSVLPRWDNSESYYLLGEASDELLSDPTLARDWRREQHWLLGAALRYQRPHTQAVLSFHEQRQFGEVARRNLGLDAAQQMADWANASLAGIFDLDSVNISSARLRADADVGFDAGVSLEYYRVRPELLLSKQSVFSVFASDAVDELAAGGFYRLAPQLRLDAEGALQLRDGERGGRRGQLGVSYRPDREGRVRLRLAYARLIHGYEGYDSVRVALGLELLERLSAVADLHAYWYDEPIAGYTSSNFYALNLSWQLREGWSLLWGGSLSRSPYARADLQTLLRMLYVWDGSRGAGARGARRD